MLFLYKGKIPVPSTGEMPRVPPVFLHCCEGSTPWLQLWAQWVLQSLCGVTQKPTRYVQQLLGGETDPPFHLCVEYRVSS